MSKDRRFIWKTARRLDQAYCSKFITRLMLIPNHKPAEPCTFIEVASFQRLVAVGGYNDGY